MPWGPGQGCGLRRLKGQRQLCRPLWVTARKVKGKKECWETETEKYSGPR